MSLSVTNFKSNILVPEKYLIHICNLTLMLNYLHIRGLSGLAVRWHIMHSFVMEHNICIVVYACVSVCHMHVGAHRG